MALFAYTLRAKFLRQCDDIAFRDPQRAIQDATRACELSFWKDCEYLSDLADSYAEAGDFAKAIEWQTKALEFAFGDWKPDCERNLTWFRDGKTVRAGEAEKEQESAASK